MRVRSVVGVGAFPTGLVAAVILTCGWSGWRLNPCNTLSYAEYPMDGANPGPQANAFTDSCASLANLNSSGWADHMEI